MQPLETLAKLLEASIVPATEFVLSQTTPNQWELFGYDCPVQEAIDEFAVRFRQMPQHCIIGPTGYLLGPVVAEVINA